MFFGFMPIQGAAVPYILPQFYGMLAGLTTLKELKSNFLGWLPSG
jgi:hypothetical protein